jgi:CDP-diacylglycerol--glycerol-3-phosphate 3-phosphatidyltransferase
MLSVAGLGSSVAAAVVLSDGRFIIGGVIVLAGSSLDLLDGALARATNRVSKLGGFLDSSLDRLADAAVLMGLLAYFVNRGEAQESLVAVAALVGAGTVSYVKARAEGLGLSCDVGLVTRPERIVLLGVGLLTDQVIVFLYAIAILSFITAGQRFLHAAKQLRSE